MYLLYTNYYSRARNFREFIESLIVRNVSRRELVFNQYNCNIKRQVWVKLDAKIIRHEPVHLM